MPVIDKNKCMSCGMCVDACNSEAIDIGLEKGVSGRYARYVIDNKKCSGCGACLEVDCPGGAISE